MQAVRQDMVSPGARDSENLPHLQNYLLEHAKEAGEEDPKMRRATSLAVARATNVVAYTSSELEGQEESPGVLLLTSSRNAVAYNWEAAQILAFPSNPEGLKRLPALLADRVNSRLSTRSTSKGRQFVREFRSGMRTYQCRVVSLGTSEKGRSRGIITILLLLNRQPSPTAFLKRRMRRTFSLTQREWQTVEWLLQGKTTKEIAESMQVSGHTVKTYLRSVMHKMRVSTRTGIIGKILITS